MMREGILNILTDGKWHPMCHFMDIADSIQPEVAARAYIKHRDKHQRIVAARRPLSEQISKGKRIILDKHLHDLRRGGVVQIKGNGFDKQIRLTADQEPS